MEGLDNPGVFFSDNFGSEDASDGTAANPETNLAIKRRFKEFLRQFHDPAAAAASGGGSEYVYRDGIRRNYALGHFWVEVAVEDLAGFDEQLADKVDKNPAEVMPLFEEAATEVADEVTSPRPEGEEEVEAVQVRLRSEANPTSLRELSANHVSRLVKVSGIVVSASGVRAKATRISVQCRSCRAVVPNLDIKPGLEGYALPRKCNTEQAGRPKCPLDPFFIMPDKCRCVQYF